jgi:hypothetical protein
MHWVAVGDSGFGEESDMKKKQLQPVEPSPAEGEWPWMMRAHRMGIQLPCDDYATGYSAERETNRHVKEALLVLQRGITELQSCTTAGERLLVIAKIVTALDVHLQDVARHDPIRQRQVRLARDEGKLHGDCVRTDRIAETNNLGGKKPH